MEEKLPSVQSCLEKVTKFVSWSFPKYADRFFYIYSIQYHPFPEVLTPISDKKLVRRLQYAVIASQISHLLIINQ